MNEIASPVFSFSRQTIWKMMTWHLINEEKSEWNPNTKKLVIKIGFIRSKIAAMALAAAAAAGNNKNYHWI